MKVIAIQLDNGLVYVQRCELETASQDPLTDSELVIIKLYNDLKEANEHIKQLEEDTDWLWQQQAGEDY